MSTSLVAADLNELSLDSLQNSVPLRGRARVEQLLAKVVAIVIDHKLSKVLSNLVKEELNNLCKALVKLLLEESASGLIYRKVVDVSFENVKLLLLCLALFILLNDEFKSFITHHLNIIVRTAVIRLYTSLFVVLVVLTSCLTLDREWIYFVNFVVMPSFLVNSLIVLLMIGCLH